MSSPEGAHQKQVTNSKTDKPFDSSKQLNNDNVFLS